MHNSSPTISVAGQSLVERPVAATTGGLADLLAASDVVFSNFEATVAADHAWPTKTRTLHIASFEALEALARLGLTDLGHANNHAFDLGPPGIEAAHKAVARLALTLTGSGKHLDYASRPTVRAVAGTRVAILAADCGPQPDIVYAGEHRAGIHPLRIRRTLNVPPADYAVLARLLAETGEDRRQAGRAAVGYRGALTSDTLDFFGLTARESPTVADERRPDPADLALMHRRLAEARAAADLVLVSLHHHHWEPEWGAAPAWFTDLARDLIDHGADIIVGTGAPVLQPVSFYRGRPIFAGLGNFIFHTHRPAIYDARGIGVWTGAVCRCRCASGGELDRIDIVPIAAGRLEDGSGEAPAPRALDGATAATVMDRLAAGLSAGERARLNLAV